MSAWNRRCNQLTAFVLLAMVVFSPWAAGSTSQWAIWCMNTGGYSLGVLLVCRVVVRWRSKGHRSGSEPSGPRWITFSLGLLTGAILGWVLISAINARSVYHAARGELVERQSWISWLPHSYDGPSTLSVFWTSLALAAAFWSVRDWLKEPSRSDSQAEESAPSDWRLPKRARLLLWFLLVNGGLLAGAGLFEAWILESAAGGRFGPFDYRGNAAQYVNLLWPVGLGFWWSLRQEDRLDGSAGRKLGGSPSFLLPFIVMVMAIAPLASGSRGGALVALAIGGILWLASCRAAWLHQGWRRLAGVSALLAFLGAAGWVAWVQLIPRLWVTDLATPLHLSSPLGEFVLRLRLRIPDDPDPQFADLAILSNGTRLARQSPGSFAVYLSDKGGVVVRMNPEVGGRYLTCSAFPFLSRFNGRDVELEIRRGDGIRVFANGELLAERKADAATAGGWLQPLQPEWLVHGDLPAGQFGNTCDLQLVELEGGEGTAEEAGRPILARVEVPVVSAKRLALLRPDDWSGRRELYESATAMSERLPAWLGAGPGSFSALFLRHCAGTDSPYQPHAHDDWLEFRITFGRVGTAMLVAMLLLSLINPCLRGGASLGRPIIVSVWLALGGCLVHAKFDYPFQNHAVLFAFIVLSAICAASTSHTEVSSPDALGR